MEVIELVRRRKTKPSKRLGKQFVFNHGGRIESKMDYLHTLLSLLQDHNPRYDAGVEREIVRARRRMF